MNRLIFGRSTDPWHNLAFEELLFPHTMWDSKSGLQDRDVTPVGSARFF